MTKQAVAIDGSVGSLPEETVITVGATGSCLGAAIWTLGDDVETLPAWNRSSTELAFGLQREVADGGPDAPHGVPIGLWVIDTHGGHRKLLVGGEIGAVAWSPDGSQIAFIEDTQTGSIPAGSLVTVSPSGGAVRILGHAGAAGFNGSATTTEPISWSPDGKTILVGSTPYQHGPVQWEVRAFSAAGGPPTELARGLGPLTGVSWSPSSTQFAVSSSTYPPPRRNSSATKSATTAVANATGPTTTITVFDAKGGGERKVLVESTMEYLVQWLDR